MMYRPPINPLAPHAYWHDVDPRATYLVVKQYKAHSCIFKVRFSTTEAANEARRRGMKPLYAVRLKARLQEAACAMGAA